MYIIDLIKNTDTEAIVNALAEIPGFFYFIEIDCTISEEERQKQKEIKKGRFRELICDIKQKEVALQDKYLFMLLPDIANENCYSISLLDLSEIESVKESLCFERAEDFSNPMCGIFLMDRNELLGTRISEYCTNKYGAETCLAYLINEMTFFGVDEEYCRQNQEEEKAKLQEIHQRIEEGKERCIPADEVFRELGIEEKETPEEKERRQEELWKQIEKRIFEYAEDIKEAIAREGF